MKRIINACCLFALSSLSNHLFAANRFWIGSTNWNNPLNWSASSGGAGGASVPGAADAVVFDNNGLGNCTIDAPVNVMSIAEGPSYTGTISQGSNTISLSGVGSFSSGTFIGGSANITIGGVFTNSGTAFTSTTAILELRDNAAFTGGTFIHNSGTVRFNCTNNPAQAITGTGPVFNILEFAGIARTYTLSALISDITVVNSLNLSGTLFYNLAGGVIDVQGDINSTNTATGCGGDAQININGAGTQNFNGSTIAGAGSLTQLTINKASGTLNLANFPSVSNNFTYTAGTINPGTSTFSFSHGNAGAYNITGSLSLANIEFPINTGLLTVTIAAATILTATGDLTIAGAGNLVVNTGNINVNGNILLTNTGPGGGGSAVINIVGIGAESIDGTAVVVNQSRLPALNINKASGTLTLLGNISFSANVTYAMGTINAGTSNCYIVNNLTMTGNFSLFNLFISPAGNTTVVIAAASTVTVTNNFDIEGAANNISINTGTIAVQGNIIDNNTGLNGGGSAILLINGTAAQNITSPGVIYQGSLPGLTINKATGTLLFPALITIRGNYTYTTGTIDVTTNNSTVVFANFITITGSHTLNNIVFDAGGNYTITISAGTVLTATGNMTISGANSMTLNFGNINVNGNLILTNTGVVGGGNTVISFVSAGNQSITGALLINQSSLPAVTINKAGGTLTLPALITVRGNWTYTAGILDVTTNNATVVFSNTLTITGSQTLKNVNFEGSFNNVYTIPTGTLLTVPGTLTFSGASNVTITTTIAAATAIQSQGDIAVTNTAIAGGGLGTLLINGAGAQAFTSTVASGQGRMPNITIQKASGTLTLSGIISESRNWTYTSGTVDAITSTSTVVFGGNNLTIASAGMNFYNASFTANTSTLSNNLTIANTLTLSGAAILAPGANTINLGGNWSNWGTGGFTEATSTVNFNGSALQTITSPGGDNFTNFTVNNSGAGTQLTNPVIIGGMLTMTLGNIDLNGKALSLGLSTASSGTLNYTAGSMLNTGSFTRWFPAVAIAGNAGLFPMGTATDARPFFVSTTAAPTTGGTIAVAYTDAATNSSVSFADGAATVVVRKDLNWGITTANSLAGGTYNLSVDGTGLGTIGSVSDLRLTLVNSVTGTAGLNAGTTSNPQINRTGLTLANLTNTFYVGSVNAINSPLPVTWISFTATVGSGMVELDWSTAAEINNDYFTIQRSKDAIGWDNIGQLAATGTTSVINSYNAYDRSPYEGISYYRLIQTDLDGKMTYSSIKAVRIESSFTIVSVYPNPATDNLYISSSSNDIVLVTIFNSNGENMHIPFTKNGNLAVLFVHALASAIYFIRIDHKTFTETRRIVVRK